MKNLKFSLVDNDFAINAETNLELNDKGDQSFERFLRSIEEELVTGETAYLEIEGLHKAPIKFAISHTE